MTSENGNANGVSDEEAEILADRLLGAISISSVSISKNGVPVEMDAGEAEVLSMEMTEELQKSIRAELIADIKMRLREG
ncbi:MULTISPECIES: hypothetical protein [Nguyenibacter]|uniref:YbaB/EbfC DNA-binding family protein n=1 Tax=Nguyenibacter vanlangensis TaxID=1216886 RepID=A0ABZ3D2J1_9PROT|nr:hypothetical protein [Nguyenibacter sp. L1]WRH89576.1 hypothetical protein QN315_08300 [Nguyenibacter sp. L1]